MSGAALETSGDLLREPALILYSNRCHRIVQQIVDAVEVG